MRKEFILAFFLIFSLSCSLIRKSEKSSQNDINQIMEMDRHYAELGALAPYEKLLGEQDFEAHWGSWKNSCYDTVFIIRNLNNEVGFAIIITRNSCPSSIEASKHNADLLAYKISKGKFEMIGEFHDLFVEELKYKFMLENPLYFVLGADGYNDGGLCHVFILDLDKGNIIKLKRDLYNPRFEWPGLQSKKDTFPSKENNLRIKFTISEEYFKVDNDSVQLISGIYKKINENYLVSKAIDFKGNNGGLRTSCDSILIDDIDYARFLIKKWE